MKKTGLLMIPEVVNFVREVFGAEQTLEIESGDTIIRNEGRRVEDIAASRSFLEYKSSAIVFRVILDEEEGEVRKRLPPVFSNPDYVKVLRNKFREINRVEIQYWQLDFLFKKRGEKEGITFVFTVRCGSDD